METCVIAVPSNDQTLAPASISPNGLTPLKNRLARPSQKLRLLKTALMMVGVLRPVTCRALTPPMLKVASGTVVELSAGDPSLMFRKSALISPCEPVTSFVSDRTALALLFGSANLWNG